MANYKPDRQYQKPENPVDGLSTGKYYTTIFFDEKLELFSNGIVPWRIHFATKTLPPRTNNVA